MQALFRHARLAALMIAFTSQANAAETFQDLSVEVRGSGQPVVMIPGLNSAGATWEETCAALQPVECHILHLPGFAGRPAIETGAFLNEMRDRIAAYIESRQLRDPVLMGHSLGGVLSLMVAIEKPGLPARLIIVDALPFMPAAQNPAATVASIKPMAEGMRAGMLNQPEAAYRENAKRYLAGMTRSAERTRTLEQWGETSARTATAEAMYDLMTTDLRSSLAHIEAPVLVLGSWAAYAQYGATKESTAEIFKAQYAGLEDMELHLSENGYHFLMWDDPEWLVKTTLAFIRP